MKPYFNRHCERSEAIQTGKVAGEWAELHSRLREGFLAHRWAMLPSLAMTVILALLPARLLAFCNGDPYTGRVRPMRRVEYSHEQWFLILNNPIGKFIAIMLILAGFYWAVRVKKPYIKALGIAVAFPAFLLILSLLTATGFISVFGTGTDMGGYVEILMYGTALAIYCAAWRKAVILWKALIICVLAAILLYIQTNYQCL